MKPIDEVPVVMERLSFKRTTLLLPDTDIQFYVNILKKTGDFEIVENDSPVATGNIKLLENYTWETENKAEHEDVESEILTKDDFYTEILLRKYGHKDLFRSVAEYDLKKHEGKINWYKKYDCFLDALIQTEVLNHVNDRNLLVPTYMDKLIIHPIRFLNAPKGKGNKNIFQTNFNFL